MRLVDVDAVTYETITRAGDDEAVEVILRCDLESLPTVCCEECEYRKADTCYCEWIGTWFSRDFGCSHFERREP